MNTKQLFCLIAVSIKKCLKEVQGGQSLLKLLNKIAQNIIFAYHDNNVKKLTLLPKPLSFFLECDWFLAWVQLKFYCNQKQMWLFSDRIYQVQYGMLGKVKVCGNSYVGIFFPLIHIHQLQIDALWFCVLPYWTVTHTKDRNFFLIYYMLETVI